MVTRTRALDRVGIPAQRKDPSTSNIIRAQIYENFLLVITVYHRLPLNASSLTIPPNPRFPRELARMYLGLFQCSRLRAGLMLIKLLSKSLLNSSLSDCCNFVIWRR